MRVEIISGSARHNSQTKSAALYLYQQLQAYSDIGVGLIELKDWNLPPVQDVFQSELETPDDLKEIARRMLHADALILVSPEYNGSYSSAMKYFLDHFPKQMRKTFAIITAFPGALGGIRAAMQLQNLTYGLMGIGSPQMLIVPEVDKKFSSADELTDKSFSNSVTSFFESFVWLGHAVAYAKAVLVLKKCA